MRKYSIAVCLDEIDACYERLRSKKPLDKDALRRLNSWVNIQKRKLKELKYKGNVPRRPRNTKKPIQKKAVEVEFEATIDAVQPEETPVEDNIGRLCIFGELPEYG